MKRIALIIVLLMSNIMLMDAQKKTVKKAGSVVVPPNVETRFSADYTSTAATWTMIGKNYAASFKDKNTGMGRVVTYNKAAEFMRLDSESDSGYPAPIGEYLKKNFGKEKNTVWSSNDDWGTPFYYVKRKGKTIYFDKDGNYSAKHPGKFKK